MHHLWAIVATGRSSSWLLWEFHLRWRQVFSSLRHNQDNQQHVITVFLVAISKGPVIFQAVQSSWNLTSWTQVPAMRTTSVYPVSSGSHRCTRLKPGNQDLWGHLLHSPRRGSVPSTWTALPSSELVNNSVVAPFWSSARAQEDQRRPPSTITPQSQTAGDESLSVHHIVLQLHHLAPPTPTTMSPGEVSPRSFKRRRGWGSCSAGGWLQGLREVQSVHGHPVPQAPASSHFLWWWEKTAREKGSL